MLWLFTAKGARNLFYDVVGCLKTQNLYIAIRNIYEPCYWVILVFMLFFYQRKCNLFAQKLLHVANVDSECKRP